jgi:hypothetical protein
MLRNQLNSLIRLRYVKRLNDMPGINGYVFDDWSKCNKFLEQVFAKHMHKRVQVGIFRKGNLEPVSLTYISYEDSVLEINDTVLECNTFDEELTAFPVIVWYSDESVFVSFLLENDELLSIKFPDKV